MPKKKITQLSLIFLILILITITFIQIKKNKNNRNSTNTESTLDIKTENSNNIIQNIFYESEDKNGNRYEIKSKEGQVDSKNPDIIIMDNVIALIYLSGNSKVIKISSKKAKYNNKTFHTIFNEDVFLLYEDNRVYGDKLELEFEKNKIYMSKNIVFNNLNSQLKADRVEIDLIEKSSKIFMDKITDKILAKYWN